MNNPDESLFLRWSRRKQEARRQKADETAPIEPGDESLLEAMAEPGLPKPMDAHDDVAPPSENPADAENAAADVAALPDVETLSFESDFTQFLRDGVPELVKRAALRKLWVSDPVLANLDGLNDYDPLTMTFLQELEGPTEPVAEIGRGLRDKIMDAKRGRDDRPGAPRRRGPGHGHDELPAARDVEQAQAEPAAGDRYDDGPDLGSRDDKGCDTRADV